LWCDTTDKENRMSLDLAALVRATTPDELTTALPEMVGLTGVEAILGDLATLPGFDLAEAIGLSNAAEISGALLSSPMYESLIDNVASTAIGSILDQMAMQTSLVDFATAGLLDGISPILDSVLQVQQAQIAPVLEAIRQSYADGLTSPALISFLAEDLTATPIGLSTGSQPVLGLLDFATPDLSGQPELRKSPLPVSPEVERYETLSATETVGLTTLHRVEELLTGVQLMLHADARNLEQRNAEDDRQRRIERRLVVLFFVLSSVIGVVQILKG